jgi:hypothetical protein
VITHYQQVDDTGPPSRAPSSGRRGNISRRTRAGVVLTLAFWGSNYALLTLGSVLAGREQFAAIAGMRVLTTIVGLGFCYLIHLLLAHPKLNSTKRRLIALAFVAPVAAELFAWTAYFAEAAIDPAVSAQPFTWSGALRTVSFWTWFFLAWSGLYLALMYGFDVQEEQTRAAKLKEEIHAAKLQALHSQINPHFLFNSLNSVSALIMDGKADLAEEMITKLAQFLRLGLAADPKGKILLSSEIELQRLYLEIERLRYPDLIVDIDLPDDLANALVPSLILQPIVENAVKYGVAGAPAPAALSISASSCDAQLCLEVVDGGKGGNAAAGAGIGLRNIAKRLELIYGEDQVSLNAGPGGSGEFRVQVTIPLER